MGDRLSDLPGGVLIPSRCTLSTLADNDGSSTGSDYTEANPRPGSAVPLDSRNRLRVHASHAQGVDLDVRVRKAGMPGRGEAACQVAIKPQSSSDWRGWNPPVILSGWLSVDYTTSDSFQRKDCVTVPSTQTVVVVRRSATSGEATSRTISPSWAVSAASASTMADGDDWNHPALVALPDERLLCFYGGATYYSDDNGTTWSTYSGSADGGQTTTNWGRTRAVYYRGDILLLVEDTATSGTVHQLASSDLGSSFTYIGAEAGLGTNLHPLVTPEGICLVYLDSTVARARRLASPWEPLDRTAWSAVALSGRIEDFAAAASPSGAIYLMSRDLTAGSYWDHHSSTDGGASWTKWSGCAYDSGSTADYPSDFAAAWQQGQMVVCHSWTASTATADNSLGAMILGGWSSVTTGPGRNNGSTALRHRYGSAGYARASIALTAINGRTWLPIELPDNGAGWTLSGSGTAALASGELQISTSAAQAYYSRALSAGGTHIVAADLRVDSGGDLGTMEIGLSGEVADGTDDWHWQIRLAETGYRVWDVHGAVQVGSDQSLDLTEEIQIWVQVSQAGAISVYHRRRGATAWTEAASGALTSDTATPGAAGSLEWGHRASGTASSAWTMLHASWYIGNGAEPRIYEGVANIYGAPLGAHPEPIPDASDGDGLVAFLAATSGPGRQDDGLTLDAEHDHPVDALFPEVSPSPSARWRSTSTDEQVLSFDLDNRTWLGGALGLYVAHANFRTAYLEYYDGAAWQTAGTLDLAAGFSSGLTYSMTGDTIYPASGTSAGDRYLWEGELIGGTAILGGTYYREILGQCAGSWTEDTTARPEVRLDGLTGAEASTGTLTLVAPSGLLVVYLAAAQRRRRWRVRIPSQTTPHGYFRAGLVQVGRVQPWGARTDWTMSDEWRPNVESTRSAYGTSRARERGPVSRAWTLAWQEGVDLSGLRAGSDPDYHGAAGGLPLAAAEDVPLQLAGLLRELRGGQTPCVVVEELPATTTTITDPTRILYGRLTGTVRWNGMLGTRGSDEAGRVEAVTVEEIV